MATRPRVVVVGLGPAGPDLVDPATLDAITHASKSFVRTHRHPGASIMAGEPSFDHVYDDAATLGEVYTRIVDELVASATDHGEVLYAVPGSPSVAERTVQLLRGDPRVVVDVRPAMSFLDLVWDRLAIDPVADGVRVVDGQRFSVEAAGERAPLVVAQCDSVDVLSDIKLTLDAGRAPTLDAAGAVTVLQRLGTTDEHIAHVAWTELDQVVEPDHLTTLWIPTLAAPVAREVARFAELVATLRRECPWDREQTHDSLMRHLVEETYEVLDAIQRVDETAGTGYSHLEEELGDLLFQVVFHATLAAEAGQFTLADVAESVHDKLYRRHPHVFADVAAASPDEVVRNWEQIKQDEKGRASVFEGIPTHLPSLLLALKIQKKSETLYERGVEVPPSRPVVELLETARVTPDPHAIGELLFGVTDLARRSGVDPEMALRASATRHRDRVAERERRLPR